MPDHGAGAEAATAGRRPRRLRRHSGLRGWGLGTGSWGLGIGAWGTGTLYRISTLVPILKELLDVVDGVVGFAGIEIGLHTLALHLRGGPLTRLAKIFHQRLWHFAQESRRDGAFLLATAKAP